MIVGIFLRNIKTYSGINYIPLNNGQNFSGLVGNNGIGKSSVLEALDSFFNNRQWNHNIITRKSGFSTTKPHIVPVFLFKKEEVDIEEYQLAEQLSTYVWEVEEADILSQNRSDFKVFLEQRALLARDFSKQEYLILPVGVSHDMKPSLSIFHTKKLSSALGFNNAASQGVNDDELSVFESLIDYLKEKVEYIYIPKDIEPETFAQLETKEIQSLMGEKLTEIVERCVPHSKIQEINTGLNSFIDNLSSVLQDYSFRTVGERQVKLRKMDVYKLIIEAYFKIRKLHKREGAHWLEMSALSSGEKQKAIIELAYHFLKSYRSDTKKIVLAIDEPESSLHMSACYDQFNKLYEVSALCKQLIFTTHWYGFIPTIEDGCVSVISKKDNGHVFDMVDVKNYREGVKQSVKTSKGQLPYDIRLKSINDFTQSIITSMLTDEPFNWLICEGSSEKIYFEKYFEDVKDELKLRIIPVGGASEIKRVYDHLQVAYEDFKKEIKGKVVLVSDTDVQLVKCPTKDELSNLRCYRIINNIKSRKTELVKTDSQHVSPKTEIEDVLNGKIFHETLLEMSAESPELLDIINSESICEEEASFFAMDLSPSKQEKLDKFFDAGNNKFKFAQRYVEKVGPSYQEPSWITELKKYFQ